jgi:hypothetical protein
MVEHQETFFTLLKDPAHWLFELFLIFIFDGVIGMVLWPLLKKWSNHHESDDKQIEDLRRRVEDLERKLT